jgi:hypothetical protein
LKPQLRRTTFSTSRFLDFASIKELTAQTGREVGEWPVVIVKELVDNAIDECEEAGVDISDRTLERWRHESTGSRFVKAGRRVLYQREDVELWLAAGLRQSTSDRGGCRG